MDWLTRARAKGGAYAVAGIIQRLEKVRQKFVNGTRVGLQEDGLLVIQFSLEEVQKELKALQNDVQVMLGKSDSKETMVV